MVSRRSVSKRYKVGNKKKRRLVIPNQIKKLYNITQSNEGFKGLQAGASHDSRITNVSLRPGDVEWPLFYNRYAGSQAISLEMKHSHMDELAMTLKLYDGVNFKSLIKGIVS